MVHAYSLTNARGHLPVIGMLLLAALVVFQGAFQLLLSCSHQGNTSQIISQMSRGNVLPLPQRQP